MGSDKLTPLLDLGPDLLSELERSERGIGGELSALEEGFTCPTLFAHRARSLRTSAAGRAGKSPAPGGSTEAAAGGAESQAGG